MTAPLTDSVQEREAQSVAAATGGDYLLIQSTSATGPAIAENFVDKGVVFFDSHGTQSGTSSYLCLTTNSGITQEDYNNGWAVRSGSAAFIDGRYIEHHTPDTLSNCLVWMAICEGMKRQRSGHHRLCASPRRCRRCLRLFPERYLRRRLYVRSNLLECNEECG